MGLSSGFAIFVLGMDRTVSGLKGFAGNRLRRFLGHLAGNRWCGAATGAEITAIIQSSSVTTVVVVGLVSGQAMTLLMSVGVIFGANVGTTITAQIIAFKVTRYALAVVAIRFAIDFFSKTERLERFGRTVMGLGLVFFGMSVMGLAMEPPKNTRASSTRWHPYRMSGLALHSARSSRRSYSHRLLQLHRRSPP